MNGSWLALFLVAIGSGCGTVRNLSRAVDYDPSKPAIQTYGGVEIDKAEIASGLKVLRRIPPEAKAIPATGQILAHAADTPFSFVGDTVTFPYCYLRGIGQYYTREIARMDGSYEGDLARCQRLTAEAAAKREGEMSQLVNEPPPQ